MVNLCLAILDLVPVPVSDSGSDSSSESDSDSDSSSSDSGSDFQFIQCVLKSCDGSSPSVQMLCIHISCNYI